MLTIFARAKRKIVSPITALLAAAVLLGGLAGVTTAPAPAQADEPVPAATEFKADLCATDGVPDETFSDPQTNTEPNSMPDLTRVFGQRLDDYNAGHTVLLYNTTGYAGGGTPSCGVHYDEATGGPVSEWLYCTDQTSKTCSKVDENGFLMQGSTHVGQLQNLDGNSRLSAEQSKIISYIIRNELPVPNDGGMSFVDTASNATALSRDAKQNLVWCVSDRDVFNNPYQGPWCDEAMGPEKQAEILASMPENPELSISPASAEVAVAETATMTLTTNLVNQPITLISNVDGLELCADQSSDAELKDGELTISATASNPQTAELCFTSDTSTTANIQASAQAYSGDEASWVQSPGTEEITCQVYALTSAGTFTDLAAETEITVTEVPSPEAVTPAAPIVNPAECTEKTPGETIWETVTKPENGNGITYSDVTVNDDHVATLTATPEDGYVLDADQLGEGWTMNDDGTATWTYQLKSSICDSVDSSDLDADTSETESGLANTGATAPFIAGTIALLLIAAGAGALTLRRRSQV